MADVVDKKTRSRTANDVREPGENTRPEVVLRKYLHALGFRYRHHVASLPGSLILFCPDTDSVFSFMVAFCSITLGLSFTLFYERIQSLSEKDQLEHKDIRKSQERA